MPRSTQVPPALFSVSDTGLSPAVVWLSSQLLLPTPRSLTAALQPRTVETARFGLFPFRSPLLWESRLISFPLGTEMFHFPRSRIFSSSPRLIAAYHVFHRLQRQGIRPLLLITCFSRKKPLIIPCSIVKDLAVFPAAAGLNPGSKSPAFAEAFSQDSPFVCLVEADRIELTTLCLQSRCSPN